MIENQGTVLFQRSDRLAVEYLDLLRQAERDGVPVDHAGFGSYLWDRGLGDIVGGLFDVVCELERSQQQEEMTWA